MNYTFSQSVHTLNHWQSGASSAGYLTALDLVIRIVKEKGGSVYSDCPAITDSNVNTNHIWGRYSKPYTSPFNAAIFNKGEWLYLPLVYKDALQESPSLEGIPGYGYTNVYPWGINLGRQGSVTSGTLYNTDMAYYNYLLNASGSLEYGGSTGWKAEWTPGELVKHIYAPRKLGQQSAGLETISLTEAKRLILATCRFYQYDSSGVPYSLYWTGKIYYGHSDYYDGEILDNATFTPLYVFSINSYNKLEGTKLTCIYELVYGGQYSE